MSGPTVLNDCKTTTSPEDGLRELKIRFDSTGDVFTIMADNEDWQALHRIALELRDRRRPPPAGSRVSIDLQAVCGISVEFRESDLAAERKKMLSERESAQGVRHD